MCWHHMREVIMFTLLYLNWFHFCSTTTTSDVTFDATAHLLPHTSFPKRHSTSSQPVEYWDVHPYTLQGKSRDLQFNKNDQYRSMIISFQNDWLNAYSQSNPSKAATISYITNTLLPKTSSIWSNTLKVYPTKSFSVRNPCNIVGYYTFSNKDLIVFTAADDPAVCTTSDGTSTLAAAYTGGIDEQLGRPIIGCMIVCTDGIDLNSEASKVQALDTVTHEFAHMLGLNSDLFPYFTDPLTGKKRTSNLNPQPVKCVDGITRNVVLPANNTLVVRTNSQGIRFAEIVTPTVKNIVRSQFNCINATGARLENQLLTDNDCFGSHWEARLFESEIMAAVTTGIKRFITPLTLAYFEDSGWYRPDYNFSQVSPFGRASGCSFIEDDCINNGLVPSWSINSFCISSQKGCDPSFTMVSSCSVTTYSAPLPIQYQYFPNPNVGGYFITVDYCPVFSPLRFGPNIMLDCTNRTIEENYRDFLNLFPYEVFGLNSRCYISSQFRSVCMNTLCNSTSKKVDIITDTRNYTCDSAGQIILIEGSNTKIACPALWKICPNIVCPANCAGRGLCDYGRNKCACFNSSDPSPMCLNSPTSGNVTISNYSLTINSPSFEVYESPTSSQWTHCVWKTFLWPLVITIPLMMRELI